jgi:hypothetical protein
MATTTRKGKMLAKEGSLELWVIPAEASGWRAEIMNVARVIMLRR